MSETWKLQDSISRSAALAFYLLVAGFFSVVALLGIAEQLAFSHLMLPILSLTLVKVCALISLGFTAVVFRWQKLQWLSGLLLLALATQLGITGSSVHELSGIPLSVLILLLVMSATALLLPLHTRFSQFIWKIFAAVTFGYGVFLQLCLWFPALSGAAQTPFSSSLIPVMLLMGGIALALRQHFALTLTAPLNRSTLIAILMFQAGYGVWFALTLYDIKYETNLAEQKTQRVVNQVETQLHFSETLFSRANARWQRVSATERLNFMAADLADLTKAYTLIHGAIVYDGNLNPSLFTGQAEAFYQQGLLSNPALKQWLQQKDTEFSIATNGASLNTKQPFLMLKLYVPLTETTDNVVLIFINLQQALIADNADNGAQLKIYLEVLPDVLLSADHDGFYRSNLADLTKRYRYYFKILPQDQQWNGRSFYVFVSDIGPLHARSRLHQAVLWVALVFCCTFVLAADRTRLLRREKAKLVSLAKFDDITGLLRRDAFYHATEQSVQPSETQLPEAMIFIDLDGFKPINDSFGHDVGDKLLTEIANRIRLLVGEQTLLARFSGDEFLVYLTGCHATDAERLAQNILKSIAGPSSTTGFNVYLTASIGIVINTQPGKSSQLLTQLADVAMSYAKQAGGNTYRFYQQAMAEDYRSIMAIRNRLQAALDAKRLQVFYQPVIDFVSGKVVAIESLVRWHDQGRFISPAEFIPIAEQTGQIIQLGEQVTEMVLRDLRDEPLLAGLSAAINVSSQQLRRYDYVSFLEQALRRFTIAPERICVELTESALLEGQSNAFLLPERIKQMGCLLALDDFGTGYSSLSYLYRLPADSIKLDRSFTQDLQYDANQRKIVEMIVSTCKQIGKIVVIEGVETPEMAKLCRELGCDRVQGYYYARPMALADLIIFLREQSY